MKIYETKAAPNPRRVRVFLAEKGIEVPYVEVNMMKGEHKTPDYRKLNPLGQVPTLELDDGTIVTETLSICRYFEETNPEPPLFGRTALEKAHVDMWQRRVEFGLMLPVAFFFRHTNPMMAQLEEQNPEWGNQNKDRAIKYMKFMDRELEGHDYLVGDYFSVADIVGLTTVDFAKFAGLDIPAEFKNLTAWHQRLAARPSAKA
ncbi:glutathione S-transferase family protein [Tepidicaulis sp.]|uniref:glutathione S-transferase family protein n=1 Tax=Tepidicaulis sp. TaxID=1920809 RepID=UPI003B5C12AB